MNWPLTVGLMMAGTVFVVGRIWVRRRIVKGWLEDRISNRMTASLLVLTFFAPMLLMFLFAVITHPGITLTLALVFALIFAPMLALGGGLMDYAAQHGVKERILKDREARRHSTAKTSQQTDGS